MKSVKHFLRTYLRHLRAQPKEAQRIHAFSISGIITIVIAVMWLHFHYGFWSGGEYVADNTVYETNNLTKAETDSPAVVLSNFFGEAKKQVNNIFSDMNSFFSSSTTFERNSTPETQEISP